MYLSSLSLSLSLSLSFHTHPFLNISKIYRLFRSLYATRLPSCAWKNKKEEE